MKRRSTIATRIMRLAPAILQAIWGPALCVAMVNTQARTQATALPASFVHDPISAVYASILNPLGPAGSLARDRSCMAPLGLAATGVARDHARFSALLQTATWNTGFVSKTHAPGIGDPAQACRFRPWSTYREPGLKSAFTAFYAVNSRWGIPNRKFPSLVPSYWGRPSLSDAYGAPAFAPPSPNAFFHNLPRLDEPLANPHFADLVKADLFKLISLAQGAW